MTAQTAGGLPAGDPSAGDAALAGSDIYSPHSGEDNRGNQNRVANYR
jgi:hypothetical protein